MCYDDNARPPLPPGTGSATRAEDLVLIAADGNHFAAYRAEPDGPARAQALIFPDVRGLHQFYKDLAVRFAEQGISALAIDYFGRTAGLGARDDSFEVMPHVQQMRFDTVLADAQAALANLGTGDATGRPTFTVGFCMGGALSLLTGTQDASLAGVIGFYPGLARNFGGGGTVLERAGQIKYPVLALFGGADQGIPPDQVAVFEHEMDAAGVPHEVVTYPGAPHSFFDRRATEYAGASADAWARVLGFIAAHAGS